MTTSTTKTEIFWGHNADFSNTEQAEFNGYVLAHDGNPSDPDDYKEACIIIDVDADWEEEKEQKGFFDKIPV